MSTDYGTSLDDLIESMVHPDVYQELPTLMLYVGDDTVEIKPTANYEDEYENLIEVATIPNITRAHIKQIVAQYIYSLSEASVGYLEPMAMIMSQEAQDAPALRKYMALRLPAAMGECKAHYALLSFLPGSFSVGRVSVSQRSLVDPQEGFDITVRDGDLYDMDDPRAYFLEYDEMVGLLTALSNMEHYDENAEVLSVQRLLCNKKHQIVLKLFEEIEKLIDDEYPGLPLKETRDDANV